MRVGRRSVEISNEDKVLFPDAGITKGRLVRYYRGVARTMLRHLAGRPIALQRFPDGIDADGFYQKQVPDHFPEWIGRVEVDTGRGRQVHAECNDAATLVFLADQACVTLHHWLSRSRARHRPDRMVIDLDPQADGFEPVVDAARAVRAVLDECALVPFVQTTGSRGLHVVTPLAPRHDFDEVRAFATGVARLLEARHPETLTTAQRKDERGTRLFLDVVRNAYGQTAVAPYSVRARPGAPVAAPLEWDELGGRVDRPDAFTVETMPRRLGQREDPWKGIGRRARGLARPWTLLRAMLREAGVDDRG